MGGIARRGKGKDSCSFEKKNREGGGGDPFEYVRRRNVCLSVHALEKKKGELALSAQLRKKLARESAFILIALGLGKMARPRGMKR